MLNKKRLVLFILIFSLTAGGCHFFWVKYYNKKYGFSIFLPRFWEREEGYKNTVVIARVPPADKDDKFRENVNVIAAEFTEDTPVDTFFEINKDTTMKLLPGVKLDFSEGEIFAGRLRGRYFLFTNKANDGLVLKIKSAVWIKNKRAYIVTCIGDFEDYSYYESYFNKIMRSLRIK